MKNIKPILKYFKKYKISLIILSVIIFISNINYIFTGYLNGTAIEAVVNSNVQLALKCYLIYFILSIVVEVASRIAFYGMSKIQIMISRTIGYDTFKKVMSLPAYAFEKMSSGEILNRLSNDTEVIVGSVEGLISIFSSLVSSLIILIYIFANSWFVGLEIIIFLFIYSFVVYFYGKKFKIGNEESKKEYDKLSAISTESVRGVREIKTLGVNKTVINKYADTIKKLFNKSIKVYQDGRDYDVISSIMKILLECGVFMTCAVLAFNKMLSTTFFVAMTYYIYRYTWVIENIREFSKTYQSLSVSIGRVNEILFNQKFNDVEYGNVNLVDAKGIIEFKSVTFGYPEEKLLLKDFNITFEPNKKIAVVGSSGEGKSTLFNLITRLFDPIKGSIYLDDIDLKLLSEESLRENISIIRQEPFIFNRTVKENFELIKPGVTIEEIRKYCKMAYIDDYIMSLPNKYDTLLGEGGVNLSGGQKQRLAIARTLMKNSKVILFDEATSALDNESQEYIKNSINELAVNHTLIIVAHRLSTIVDADIIFVIKDGKVYAKGTHKSLLKNCAFYKNLYLSEDKNSSL